MFPLLASSPIILKVKVGTSINDLRVVKVNAEGVPEILDSPEFTGRIGVRIANFNGVTPDGSAPLPQSPYFGKTQRYIEMFCSFFISAD